MGLDDKHKAQRTLFIKGLDRGYACRCTVGAGRDCDDVGSGAAGAVVFKRRLEKLFATRGGWGVQ